MKTLFRAGSCLPLAVLALAAAFSGSAYGRTWIGQVSDQHCTPEHKALPGDDERCIVFIANDKQVYTVENQDAIRPHAGHDVQIMGTLNEEMVIGISYETQGIIHVDTIRMLAPAALNDADKAQLQTWMKGMQPQVLAVRGVIVAKDKTPLATEANKLSDLFSQVGVFLRKQKAEEAAKFADTARDSAKAIGTAPTQVEQILALRKVQEACSGCHVGYRAGKQGDYKLQP